MKKFVEKIKAWFKEIDWKEVGRKTLMLVGAGIAYAIAGEVYGKIVDSIMHGTSYGMNIYNEAARAANEDGLADRFNAEWDRTHPDFDPSDEAQLQAQCDAYNEMFKSYLDKCAKKHKIGKKFLDFDEHEAITLRVIDESKGLYSPTIHATIKKID